LPLVNMHAIVGALCTNESFGYREICRQILGSWFNFIMIKKHKYYILRWKKGGSLEYCTTKYINDALKNTIDYKNSLKQKFDFLDTFYCYKSSYNL
jgi:hypothetical protein